MSPIVMGSMLIDLVLFSETRYTNSVLSSLSFSLCITIHARIPATQASILTSAAFLSASLLINVKRDVDLGVVGV